FAVSFDPCCVHVAPDRVNTHAAPTWLLSKLPPIRAVLPSAESAVLFPKPGLPTKPVGTSAGPCCAQETPERTNTNPEPGAPAAGARARAVSPSAESATLGPSAAPGLATVSLDCWVQVTPERMKAHTAPAPLLSPSPPISAVFPSAESAMPSPKSPAPISL